MDRTIEAGCCSFPRLFDRRSCCIFLVLLGFVIFGFQATPSDAFDTSTLDTLRLGDEITSDILDQIKAFQAILNQPISLGLLLKGSTGAPGAPGSPGTSGNMGTVGDQGPIGENGSTGLEGRFGKTGTSGPPGEPGMPGYERIYFDRRNDPVNYANKGGNYANYNRDGSLFKETKTVCEGEQLWIGCNQKEKINITNAFWGRNDFITCSQGAPNKHSTRHYSLDYDHVLLKAQKTCNSRSACVLYATRLFLGDVTDSQVHKYLRVAYECIPMVYDENNFGVHRDNAEKKLSGNNTPLWSK